MKYYIRSPGSRGSLLKTGQVYNYCAMRGICLLNRAISPTFLPLYPGHSRFHQMYFPPSYPPDIHSRFHQMYFPHGGLGLYCRFYVLVHVRVHVCFYVRVHVRVHVRFHVRVHVHVHVRVRVHVRIYKKVHLLNV
jgi:hypothetical protein